MDVLEGFEKHDLPLDYIWLDIEHTDGKRYLTWDRNKFPDPEAMQKEMNKTGRKLVTIADPHIKADSNYWVYSEGTKTGIFAILASDMYVQTADKSRFEGHCWPGRSAYPDWLRPDVRDWWADNYKRWPAYSAEQQVWIDMNEPSVFDGPETTMPKSNLHALKDRSAEHREVHNVFGYYYQKATF